LIFRELLKINVDFIAIAALNVEEAARLFPSALERRELIKALVLCE